MDDGNEGDRAAPHVLVAEDNPINAKVIKAYLEARGYEYDVVENGQKAIDAVSTRHYDIVLMDIHMPVVDGLMATTAIRALAGEAGKIPIVAVTAIQLKADKTALDEVGLNAWVSKPIDREQLYAVIERLVAASRLCTCTASPQ
jgi:CheY-like chemotaxis protein